MSLLRRIDPEPQSSGPSKLEGPEDNLYARIQKNLLPSLDSALDLRKPEARNILEEALDAFLKENNIMLSRAERYRLFEQILADLIGWGPLEPVLLDDTVTTVMVNDPKNIFVVQKGHLTRANIAFDNDEHVLRTLNRMLEPLGQQLDADHPILEVRFSNGIYMNAIIPPLAARGAAIFIQKYSRSKRLTAEDLIRFATLTEEIVEFLRLCVIARLNILVCGKRRAGKTALLNVLASFIPIEDRIITVENAPEFILEQPNLIALNTYQGEITLAVLLETCLRFMPEHIVTGECSVAEAQILLDIMNRGNDGIMFGFRADDSEDAISQLEHASSLQRDVHKKTTSTISLIVCIEQLRDGTRKVTKISEVQQSAEGATLSNIFEFEQTGLEKGRVIGRLRPTGQRPSFLEIMERNHVELPPSLFGSQRN